VLIDRYLPRYDVRERHRTVVSASLAATYAALRAADFGVNPLVRTLLALRALPGALARGAAGLRALWARKPDAFTVATLEAHGFRLLADAPPTELVLGIEGKFWLSVAQTLTPEASEFLTRPPAAGTARGVMNFWLQSLADGTTEVATETRVQCADDTARRRFLPYWYLIRPASGIIRHAMLREIRRTAEAT